MKIKDYSTLDKAWQEIIQHEETILDEFIENLFYRKFYFPMDF